MRLPVIAWPTVIAAFVAILAINCVVGSWTFAFGPHGGVQCDWPGMVIAASLLVLSYALATRRQWARRVLLCAVVLVGITVSVRYILRAVGPHSFSDVSSERLEKLISLSLIVHDISCLLLTIAILLFGVLFLTHHDVVASFRRHVDPQEKV